jgi:hypothetical protein
MRKRRLTWFGLSCLAMLLSCKDIQVTTRIFPDGSCQRTVACTADSGRVPGNAYPIPRDSTWQSSFVRHFKDSTKTAYQAVKTFRTVAELNDYYQAENDSAFAFHCQIRLEKRFRWFYSYLTFRETWQAYNLFDKVPVTDYVSLQDLREKHNDADEEQNNKLDQWEKRALFAEFFTYVQARLPIGDLTSERLTANKEALFQALMDSTQKQETDDILATCGAVLQTPAVQHLRPVIEACMIEIEKKIEFMSDLENNSYKNVVEMPGLLVSTNSADVQNRQVSWQIDALQFRFQDYEMWATSRVINTWAFLVSGAVGFALLLLLVLALWRQRRR